MKFVTVRRALGLTFLNLLYPIAAQYVTDDRTHQTIPARRFA